MDRRTLLKGAGTAAGAAWAAPLILTAPAWAAAPGSGPPICPSGGSDTGVDLVVDGGFESDTAVTSNTANPPSGWSSWAGNVSVQAYAGGHDGPSSADPDKGNNYLYGGPNNNDSGVAQFISITDGATTARIDAGCATYTFSAWLGGFESQDDHADATAVFYSASVEELGSATLTGPLAADRGGVTELLLRSASGMLPAGTRTVYVLVSLTGEEGPDNDALADDIRFILS